MRPLRLIRSHNNMPSKKYYWRNPQKERKAALKWNKENRDKKAVSDRRYMQTSGGRYIAYRNGAKNRGLLFNISRDEFIRLVKKRCDYCNDENTQMGLDRVDNSVGYLLSNVVPCCEKCNRMKLTMTLDEFYTQIEKIYTYSI